VSLSRWIKRNMFCCRSGHVSHVYAVCLDFVTVLTFQQYIVVVVLVLVCDLVVVVVVVVVVVRDVVVVVILV